MNSIRFKRSLFAACLCLTPLLLPAQTTNLWVGPTNLTAAGSWTNLANWNPADVPDTAGEVASFVADFTTNFTVTLDGATTINGLIYNDVTNSGSTRQALTLAVGSPAGGLTFAGTAPFVDVAAVSESQPVILQPTIDIASFTKLGSGWLKLTSLLTGDLPGTLTVGGTGAGALVLDQTGSNVTVTPAGFVKSGAGQFVLSSTMPLQGAGQITVNEGRMEVRKGSTNFIGNIVVNSNAQFVARVTPYSNQFGDTNGTTTVNGGGQAKFQEPAGFTNGEVWVLNGFRADGSLQLDYTDVELTGPITLLTNSHININTFAGSIRNTRIRGLIDDGPATNGVTFTIGYGGGAVSGTTDLQWTNYATASRFILSASNTYGGPTYISVRTATTTATNLTLTVELTNGNNRLPATTLLTLGGIPPGVAGHTQANGRVVLDGVSQELAGLICLGGGTNNRIVSSTPELCLITLNTASGTLYSYRGSIGGPFANENNLAVLKRGLGSETLGGPNTYTGTTVVAAGVLEASNGLALGTSSEGTVVSNAAQLRLAGGIVIDEALTLTGSGPNGANLGAVRSVNGTNVVNGPVAFVGSVDGRTQTGGGNLVFNGGVTSANLTVMFATGAGTYTMIASNRVNVGTAIVKAHDPGTMFLNVAGNVMGQFNPAWGDTVILGASNALPTNVILRIGEAANSATAGSGVLDLNGYDVTCGQFLSAYSNGVAFPYALIVRNSNATPATLSVQQSSDTTFEGRLMDNLSLRKGGAGRLTLFGTNTFSNTTWVTAGTLALASNAVLVCSNIQIEAGASLSVTNRNDGSLNIGAGQVLAGAGQVLGIVSNAGRIAPGAPLGTLTIDGALLQSSSGLMDFELGGLDPTNHDSLITTGNTTLDGTLRVTLVNGYAPTAGDSFVLINSGPSTGTFATTNLPALGAGLAWQLDYFGAAVLLQVVSVPVAGGYDTFALAITNGAQRGYQDDPDGDGFANLLEYVTGANPTNADQAARMAGTRNAGQLALLFRRDTAATDATLVVEGAYAATNGTDWLGIATNIGGSWGAATNVQETGVSPVNVTVFDFAPAATNRFLRLHVTRP